MTVDIVLRGYYHTVSIYSPFFRDTGRILVMALIYFDSSQSTARYKNASHPPVLVPPSLLRQIS